MSTTPYQNAARLNKLESLAVLEDGYGRDSTANEVKFGDGLPILKKDDLVHRDDHDDDENERPVALDLSIRRGRLALLTVVAVASISTATVYFNRGLELSYFDANDKNATEQAAMLDDYNSYTGNVASAFGKPIEIFVTLAVQVIVLRFMVAAMLKPELGWKVGAVTIALSAGIGYLISNGFNALNVQLRPLEIEAFISDADLAYESSGTAGNASTLASSALSWTRTTTEIVPKNPITNTVLREVVSSRVPKAPPNCDWILSSDTGFGDVPDTTLTIGFTQRDWQTRVLQEALEPKVLRVVANSSDPNVNRNVKADDLPMDASRAADLFIYGMAMAWRKFPWGGSVGFAGNRTDVANRNPNPNTPTIARTAVISGLLPLNAETASETAKREWFLRESQKALLRQMKPLSGAYQTSLANVSMEFSSVEITPGVRFDAITIEFDVEPSHLVNSTASSDPTARYLNLKPKENCGPWPALCVVPKASYAVSSSIYYDTPAQIGTFAACVNDNGVEELMSAWPTDRVLTSAQCKRTSNSSLLVMSIGKRLLADGLWQNRTSDSTGILAGNNSAVIKNLRKVYSFTIGRLAWSFNDLSETFNATCNSANCHGLQLPLAAATNEAAGQLQQHLIVGANALPLNMVPSLPESFFTERPRLMPLVSLNEPQRWLSGPNRFYDDPVGDVLLSHNIKSVQWDMNQLLVANKQFAQDKTCNAWVEDRIYLALKNHHYIEHSLQPAYTAATFFLFQNGVVKDAVQLDKTKMSLNFEKNKQNVALFVSIPDRNAWLTLGGCAVLVVCLSYVLLLSMCRKNSSRGAAMGGIKEPQVIARVMLDEGQFPPAVLHRRVVRQAGPEKDLRQLDDFMINGISLQAPEEQDRLNGARK